jgi:hypothetical protein
MFEPIASRQLRKLDLSGSDPAHLSAASGLVLAASHLYVVADDELALGVFDLHDQKPGSLLPLSAGTLPQAHAARKAAKPDCEALALLPPAAAFPYGALLALGSGSRPTRERGFLLLLDAAGQVAGTSRTVDLMPLYAPLRTRFDDLNIEGAFADAGCITLLQRGNRNDRRNASIDFDARDFFGWLAGAGPAPAAARTTLFELGDLDGVPLAFTDGAALGDGSGDWVFSAAAEDTNDSYDDGVCRGSVIGVVDRRSGRVVQQARLAAVCKVEGIALQAGSDGRQLLLVTDADDRKQPAQLLGCTLPAPQP